MGDSSRVINRNKSIPGKDASRIVFIVFILLGRSTFFLKYLDRTPKLIISNNKKDNIHPMTTNLVVECLKKEAPPSTKKKSVAIMITPKERKAIKTLTLISSMVIPALLI